ncbi:cytoplasmic dynein 1 intermediate chain 2-like, partial [Ruditapes philippinarum]|uniref:cytoplasmic dynein 1 intermediate chain 2-like n=1 Tax=Ruditapes philippinarum TaxID=129788 RepID=UPI00295C16FF
MSDRKAELERKKAKLEMMRKERQEKERIKKMKEQTDDTPKPPMSQSARDEADKLLQDLGIPPAGEVVETTTPSDKGSESTDGSKEPTPHPTPTKIKGKSVKLAVAKVSETNIPPRENVTYCKETQTVGLEPVERDGHAGLHHHDDQEPDTDSIDISLGTMQQQHKMPHVEMVAPAHTAEDKPPVPQRELSEEEKNTILMSEGFRSFLDHSSRVIERALDEV